MSATELTSTIDRLRDLHSDKPVYLDKWRDNKRGTPNSFLRSALFPAIKGRDRQWLKAAILDSQKGYTVTFTGEQFNQDDLTVWEAAIHLVREQPLGTVYYLSAHGILKGAGMHTGLSQHKQLHESLKRLTKATVEIQHKDFGMYMGHLINSVLDDLSPHYRITVNKELINLYNGNQWTPIDYEQRKLLMGKPLALALHGFYSSHHAPYDVKLETLRAYTGSRTKDKHAYKQRVNFALKELVDIGFLKEGEVDENFMVKVVRMPSQLILY